MSVWQLLRKHTINILSKHPRLNGVSFLSLFLALFDEFVSKVALATAVRHVLSPVSQKLLRALSQSLTISYLSIISSSLFFHHFLFSNFVTFGFLFL